MGQADLPVKKMKEKDYEERKTTTPCRENMDEILIPPPLSRCLYRLSWAPNPLLRKKDLKKGSPTCPLALQITQASTIPDVRASKKGSTQLIYPPFSFSSRERHSRASQCETEAFEPKAPANQGKQARKTRNSEREHRKRNGCILSKRKLHK